MAKSVSSLKKKKARGEFLTVLPLILFTVLFIVGPLIYMVVLSFMTRAETWGTLPEFTLKNYADIGQPVYLETFWQSLRLAVISTAVQSRKPRILLRVLRSRDVPLLWLLLRRMIYPCPSAMREPLSFP